MSFPSVLGTTSETPPCPPRLTSPRFLLPGFLATPPLFAPYLLGNILFWDINPVRLSPPEYPVLGYYPGSPIPSSPPFLGLLSQLRPPVRRRWSPQRGPIQGASIQIQPDTIGFGSHNNLSWRIAAGSLDGNHGNAAVPLGSKPCINQQAAYRDHACSRYEPPGHAGYSPDESQAPGGRGLHIPDSCIDGPVPGQEGLNHAVVPRSNDGRSPRRRHRRSGHTHYSLDAAIPNIRHRSPCTTWRTWRCNPSSNPPLLHYVNLDTSGVGIPATDGGNRYPRRWANVGIRREGGLRYPLAPGPHRAVVGTGYRVRQVGASPKHHRRQVLTGHGTLRTSAVYTFVGDSMRSMTTLTMCSRLRNPCTSVVTSTESASTPLPTTTITRRRSSSTSKQNSMISLLYIVSDTPWLAPRLDSRPVRAMGWSPGRLRR